MIYLDNAATTYPKPEAVYYAVDNANRELSFNAGRGSYKVARKATKLIDETRKKLLEIVYAKNRGEVVFSSSITIAINQILNGIDFLDGDIVYVSPYEHNAVARTIHDLEKKKKIKVIEMPLNEEDLTIDLEKLKYMFLKDKPKCVCCIHVSNVTGYILPIEKIFSYAKKYGAITVLDTAQSLGIIDVNSNSANVDFIAFAGHKSLYGPFGIGGFIKIGNVKLKEYITGGTGSDSLNLNMPKESINRFEPASQNIVAIAGLLAALKETRIEETYNYEKKLTNYLVNRLASIDDVKLYVPPDQEHIGIVSFNISGYKSEEVGMILDEDFDIAVRTGYHCTPFIHKWLKDYEYRGTIRIGLGRFNDFSDIDRIINAIKELVDDR